MDVVSLRAISAAAAQTYMTWWESMRGRPVTIEEQELFVTAVYELSKLSSNPFAHQWKTRMVVRRIKSSVGLDCDVASIVKGAARWRQIVERTNAKMLGVDAETLRSYKICSGVLFDTGLSR
jgi:hypothetical protein